MKIFNISDASTPSLVKHGLVNQTFSIGGQLVKPGMYITMDDSKKKVVAAQLKHLLEFGAIALEKPPASYKPVPATKAAVSPPPDGSVPSAPPAQAAKAAAPKKAG
jgi:hypothetical protein